LCKWLATGGHGYVEQYGKYGAGYVLDCPADIERIPELLQQYQITSDVQYGLSQPINPINLERLLSRSDQGSHSFLANESGKKVQRLTV
jgi:hypothetical protein